MGEGKYPSRSGMPSPGWIIVKCQARAAVSTGRKQGRARCGLRTCFADLHPAGDRAGEIPAGRMAGEGPKVAGGRVRPRPPDLRSWQMLPKVIPQSHFWTPIDMSTSRCGRIGGVGLHSPCRGQSRIIGLRIAVPGLEPRNSDHYNHLSKRCVKKRASKFLTLLDFSGVPQFVLR